MRVRKQCKRRDAQQERPMYFAFLDLHCCIKIVSALHIGRPDTECLDVWGLRSAALLCCQEVSGAIMSPNLSQIDSSIEQLLLQLNQEGLLDDQFSQLRQLQDESNPDFVQEVVELYFEDSATKLDKLKVKLQDASPDYNTIDQLVHQFKGSSSSFGAQAIAQACGKFRELCQQQNSAECQSLLQQISVSFHALKSKLDIFLQLEKQRKQLGVYS